MLTAPELAMRLNLKKHPRSWRGGCPACSYPTALSVRTGSKGGALLYCANGCTQNALFTAVSGGSKAHFNLSYTPEVGASTAMRKQAAALRLLDSCIPTAGTPAEIYLTVRGLAWLTVSPTLRFRRDTCHPEGGRIPALVAAVQDASGATIAAHRTFLAHDGRTKANQHPQKASLGPVWGGAIRIVPHDPAKPLVIGEGIESSASAGLLTGCPAWAALSAGNLAKGLILPPKIRDILIAADPDAPGEQAAQAAALRWQAEGRSVRIARPTGDGDFNDILCTGGVSHG